MPGREAQVRGQAARSGRPQSGVRPPQQRRHNAQADQHQVSCQ